MFDTQTVLADATQALATAGIESARTDAELLLCHLLNCNRGDLLKFERISITQAGEYKGLVAQRAARIPLQHLTGRAAFRHIEVSVGPGVLTPRPETELVVDAALRHIAAHRGQPTTVVDLCSGSAAMTISIAIEAGDVDVVGLELLPPAFAWGERNLADHLKAVTAAGSRIDLRLGDVVGCADRELQDLVNRVDVVVSNPPYIPASAIPRDPEVAEHEPAAALYGGEDGLKFIKAILDAAEKLLKTGGLLVIEHGDLQGETGEVSVPRLIRDYYPTFSEVKDHLDLANRPRFTTAVRV